MKPIKADAPKPQASPAAGPEWKMKPCSPELNTIMHDPADWMIVSKDGMAIYFSNKELSELAQGHLQIVPLASLGAEGAASPEPPPSDWSDDSLVDSIIVTATVRSNGLLNLNDVKAELRKRLSAAAQARKEADQALKLQAHLSKLAGDRWDQITALQTTVAALQGSHDAAERMVNKLAEARSKAFAEMEPWLQHLSDCQKWVVTGSGAMKLAENKSCTCGLAAAREGK